MTGFRLSDVIAAGFPCEPFADQPGYYVYLLCDPETEEVFYVGKGKGKRCLHHERAALNHRVRSAKKHSRISSILAKGQEVTKVCVLSGMEEPEAYALERQIIRGIGHKALTNLLAGQETENQKAAATARIILGQIAKIETLPNVKPAMAEMMEELKIGMHRVIDLEHV